MAVDINGGGRVDGSPSHAPSGVTSQAADAPTAPIPSRLSPATLVRLSGQLPLTVGPAPTEITSDTMLAHATWGTPRTVRAIAGRPDIDAATARGVYDRGDWGSLRALAANPARLPEDVRAGLVLAGTDDAALAAAVAARGDSPPAYGLPTAAARPMSGGGGDASLNGDGSVASLSTRAEAADAGVDLLETLRPLTPSDIAHALSLGRVDQAIAIVARLGNIPTAAAIRAYERGDVGVAIQQMRSIGVDGSTANWLLRGLNRLPPPRATLAAAGAAYATAARAGGTVPDPSLDLTL